MLNVDGDALVCDLAETYGIYDMREFSPSRIAVFSYGLGENSRIKRRISGQKLTTSEMLIARILDALNVWLWMNSRQGTRKPGSVLDLMLHPEDFASETQSFASPQDFERARRKLGGE